MYLLDFNVQILCQASKLENETKYCKLLKLAAQQIFCSLSIDLVIILQCLFGSGCYVFMSLFY